MIRAQIAGGVLIALMLAACSGERLSFGEPGPASPQTPSMDMAGRWMLSAPKAPSCGMNFGGAAGAREGTIAPEGGCPGNFFMSRHWTLDQGALLINDQENQPLAHLNFAGGRFEGQSTTGISVMLARQPAPTN
jgi:hypothetical protein